MGMLTGSSQLYSLDPVAGARVGQGFESLPQFLPLGGGDDQFQFVSAHLQTLPPPPPVAKLFIPCVSREWYETPLSSGVNLV